MKGKEAEGGGGGQNEWQDDDDDILTAPLVDQYNAGRANKQRRMSQDNAMAGLMAAAARGGFDLGEEDDEDDEEMKHIRAMANQQMLWRAQAAAEGRLPYGHEDDEDEEDYGDEDDEDEDDDDEEATARMMMMMSEQERQFLIQQQQLHLKQQQQMLLEPSSYLKGSGPGGPVNMLDEEEIDIAGAMEDDLILAGAAGEQDPEIAYKAMLAGSAEGSAHAKLELKSWLQWYLALEDHDFMVEVEREFMLDKFNFIKLRESCGPNMTKKKFKVVMKLILSSKVPSEEDLQNPQFLELNQDAFDLYGRIHQRFVQTPAGLASIYQKFLNGVYGTCPRLHCDRQRLLPMAMNDKPRTSRVKVFCPRCEESYVPNRLAQHAARSSNYNLDGSVFGVSLPQQFTKHFTTAVVLPPKIYHYQPKIFGFQVFGKRGSKYFKPTIGGTRFTEDDPNADQLFRKPVVSTAQLVQQFKHKFTLQMGKLQQQNGHEEAKNQPQKSSRKKKNKQKKQEL